jgi:hypothetical protein
VTFPKSLPVNTLYSWTFTFMAIAIEVVLPQPGHATDRRWPRYKINVPVQVVTDGPMNVVIVQGCGSELNGGGMAVSGKVELANGAQVAVEFTPPYSGQPVRIRCFVRNHQDDTYGLEFITENDSDYESVAQVEAILRKMGIARSIES